MSHLYALRVVESRPEHDAATGGLLGNNHQGNTGPFSYTTGLAAAQALAKLERDWPGLKLEIVEFVEVTGLVDANAPIPMRLTCPTCGELHVDTVFATRPHHTHACQKCGHVWRPSVRNTVGVQFLPGFRDEVTA